MWQSDSLPGPELPDLIDETCYSYCTLPLTFFFINRVAGNAAYIIGTLAESELGCYRILGLSKSSHAESKRILPDLTNMLGFDDSESVMNAAGTMGTLVSNISKFGHFVITLLFHLKKSTKHHHGAILC